MDSLTAARALVGQAIREVETEAAKGITQAQKQVLSHLSLRLGKIGKKLEKYLAQGSTRAA